MLRLAVMAMVAVSTFLSSPVFAGLVLCVEQDGEFQIEFSVDGRCGSGEASEREIALAAAEGYGHCGACTDVSLIGTADDSLRPTKYLDGKTLVALPLSASGPAFHIGRIPPERLSLPPPAANPLLAHIRTVRLLV